MKLTTTKIRGQEIEITVNAGGTFVCEFEGNSYEAKTLQELTERLDKVVKNFLQQNAVDVTVLGLVPRDKRKMSYSSAPYEKGIGFVHAQLKARHERQHGVFLLTSVEGKKFQVGSYSSEGTICRRMTAEETTQYMRLATVADEAEKAAATFVQECKEDAQALLEAARKGAK